MTKLTILRGACAALALVAAPLSVSASGVNVLHDESVDGDLQAGFDATFVGDLLVGENVVRGSMNLAANLGASVDIDGFKVGLDVGQFLETYRVTSTLLSSENINAPDVTFGVFDSNGNLIGQDDASIGVDDTFVAFAAGADRFTLDALSLFGDPIDPENPAQSVAFTYEITLNVTGPEAPVVPLPASLPLLGAGLLGLGALARRRRKHGG